MKRLIKVGLGEYDADTKTDTWDMLAWIFIVLIVGVALGYTWCYLQEPIQYGQAEVDGIVGELTVIARGEICGEGP